MISLLIFASFFSTSPILATSVKGPGAFDSHAFFRCMVKTSTQLKKDTTSTVLNDVINVGQLTQEAHHRAGGVTKYYYNFESILFREIKNNEIHIHVLQDPSVERMGKNNKNTQATYVFSNKKQSTSCDKSTAKIQLPMATSCQMKKPKAKKSVTCTGPNTHPSLELALAQNPPFVFCKMAPSSGKKNKSHTKKIILKKQSFVDVAERAFMARLNYLNQAMGDSLIYDGPEIEEALSRGGDCLTAFGSSTSVRQAMVQLTMGIICKMKGKDPKTCLMPKGHH